MTGRIKPNIPIIMGVTAEEGSYWSSPGVSKSALSEYVLLVLVLVLRLLLHLLLRLLLRLLCLLTR